MSTLIAILFALLPACPTEDSVGPCKWDAQHQGNHLGTSFVQLATTIYVAS